LPDASACGLTKGIPRFIPLRMSSNPRVSIITGTAFLTDLSISILKKLVIYDAKNIRGTEPIPNSIINNPLLKTSPSATDAARAM
jgi:hypothetical protein